MKDTTNTAALIDSNGYDESAFDLLPTVDELNDVEIDDEAKTDEPATETVNSETETVTDDEVKVQAGTISICADAVGNGRVAVKVYGRHECAPAKIDSVAAEMPRLSDIHIVAHDQRNFIAKGASYNGRYYPLSNLYIFTNMSNGTDGFKKMYKFDTAKEALRKLARQELEDHIITAEAAAEITKADIEVERERETKRKAARDAFDIEWAKYERARHLAAKIALDSKSVNDNFRYCIYCAPQQPVQSALAEDYHEDNNEVFNLLPTVDELNDCRSDIEKEFDEFAAKYTDRDARFNHGERHAAKLEKKLRELDPTVEVTYDINEDGEDTFYLRFGKYVYGASFATLDAVEETFHLWRKDDELNRNTNAAGFNAEIRNALAKELAALNNGGFFVDAYLCNALYDEGYKFVSESYSGDEVHALAAALEYFDGDIEQAIAAIERGDYRHFPDVFTYEELGTEIAIGTMGGRYLPQLIVDYLDTETLGKDTANGERGKFTNFGYFAPEV